MKTNKHKHSIESMQHAVRKVNQCVTASVVEPDVVPECFVTKGEHKTLCCRRCAVPSAHTRIKPLQALRAKTGSNGGVGHIPSPSNGVKPAIDDMNTMFPCAQW